MDWKNKRILITGSAGFIGKTACEYFLAQGASVIALDAVPTPIQHPKLVVEIGKIEDGLALTKLNLPAADYAIHLAAIAHVDKAEDNPERAHTINVQGTRNVLEVCRQMGILRIIFGSSVQVYGKHTERVSETAELRPDSVYGITKKEAEKACAEFAKQTGIEVAIVRQSNTFGPGDLNAQRRIPKTIQSVLNHQPPTVRGHGLTEKDFMYIENLLDFYEKILILTKFSENPLILNAATGESRTVKDVVTEILQQMNAPYKAVQEKGDYKEYVERFNVQKAKQILGWEPRIGFKEGIRKTIEGYKKKNQLRQ